MAREASQVILSGFKISQKQHASFILRHVLSHLLSAASFTFIRYEACRLEFKT
jgi:hypothetical protein